MDPVSRLRWATIAVILAVLFASGPLVGAVDLTPASRAADAPGGGVLGESSLGDGTANATVVSGPAADLVVDRGRFGTNVSYLRVPPAVVDVERVEGRPRLVYQVRVPELGLERTRTRQLDAGTTGRLTLRMPARAFERGRLQNNSYRAEVIVRVQSFETDRVIYRRNTSVPVGG